MADNNDDIPQDPHNPVLPDSEQYAVTALMVEADGIVSVVEARQVSDLSQQILEFLGTDLPEEITCQVHTGTCEQPKGGHGLCLFHPNPLPGYMVNTIASAFMDSPVFGRAVVLFGDPVHSHVSGQIADLFARTRKDVH